MKRELLGTGQRPTTPKPVPNGTQGWTDPILAKDSPFNPENNEIKPKNKYQKLIHNIDGDEIGVVDVYSVLSAFSVTEPGLQHAIKKLLMPGMRGKATFLQDLQEAVQAINRTIVDHQEVK